MLVVVVASEMAGHVNVADEADRNPLLQGVSEIVLISYINNIKDTLKIIALPSLREYNWNVKSKASKGYEENFFFVVRNGGIFYNELETRVRLSKRRLKAGQQPSNSKLVVRHRPLSKQELKMQRYR